MAENPRERGPETSLNETQVDEGHAILIAVVRVMVSISASALLGR